MTEKKSYAQINIRLTQNQLDFLNIFCEEMELTKSQAIRLALNKLYKETTPPEMECFRLERNSKGKVINIIPISYLEYMKIQKEANYGQTA